MPILRPDLEYIIHCESDGTIIGPISKIHAHLSGVKRTLTHYGTWGMVFHQVLGKYGIQLKNSAKYGVPKWDMGVGGHNPYIIRNGQYEPLGFADNLIKEADEEIGLNLKICDRLEDFLVTSQKLGQWAVGFVFEKFHYQTEFCDEFIGLGIILTPHTKVEFKDNEVIDFKWLTPNELEEFLNGNNQCCAPLILAFEKTEKFRLKYLNKK